VPAVRSRAQVFRALSLRRHGDFLRDPSHMAAEERLRELSEALAIGYLRLLLSRRKELEGEAKLEALCEPVDAEESVAGKETEWNR